MRFDRGAGGTGAKYSGPAVATWPEVTGNRIDRMKKIGKKITSHHCYFDIVKLF